MSPRSFPPFFLIGYLCVLGKSLLYTVAAGMILLIISTGHSSSLPGSRTDSPSCKEIIDKTLASIDNVKTLQYHLNISERIGPKTFHTESIVKLNRKPRKIYMNLKGPEVLWVEGKNNGNALVNPNGFPYINLNLDPMGSILRENQHHTINEIGFDYYASIVRSSIKFAGPKFDVYFKLNGEITWNKRACYSVTADYPEFKYVDYTVKKGEDLIKIARTLCVSEFMVQEANNDKVSDYYDVSEGQVIKVPILYGKKTELLIDKQYMLPINTKVYDGKGLFESYEYDILLVDPPLKDEEFTKGYKDYHF